MTTDPEEALLEIVRILKPLTSEERQRAVNAAMAFLGEAQISSKAAQPSSSAPEGARVDVIAGGYPPSVSNWMRQHDLSSDELDQVFQFHKDGSFDIHEVPGKTKKERTLNVYVLTGTGMFLTTGDRTFQDQDARKFCENTGCLDAPNHAAILKDRGSEFAGDKNKGFSISNPGLKRAAAIIKEVAGTA